MKKLFLPLICFLLLALVSSTGAKMSLMILGGSVDEGGCLGNEDIGFEGAGAPANWTASGTGIDYDETGTVLECTQSLSLAAGSDQAVWDPSWTDSVRYWTFWFQVDNSLESVENICRPRTSIPDYIGIVKLNDDDTFTVQASGGTTSGKTSAITPGTTAKIKIMIDTSGASGEIYLWLWNGSGWDSAVSSTDGSEVGDVDNIFWINQADTENFYIDYIKTDTSDIGSPD